MHPVPSSPELATQLTLLARIRNPMDEEAWSEFYRRYCGFVSAVVRRRGGSEDQVGDVVQQVFTETVKAIHAFNHGGRLGEFRSWLAKRTGWRLKDTLRSNRNRPFESLDQVRDADGQCLLERLPAEDISEQEGHIEFQRGLIKRGIEIARKEFGPRQFQVLELTFTEMSPAEISERLGIDRRAVDAAKSRALAAFKEIIQRLLKTEV
jgi:RNA polymerase sigma-70 factor (ECF subfamily)